MPYGILRLKDYIYAGSLRIFIIYRNFEFDTRLAYNEKGPIQIRILLIINYNRAEPFFQKLN